MYISFYAHVPFTDVIGHYTTCRYVFFYLDVVETAVDSVLGSSYQTMNPLLVLVR